MTGKDAVFLSPHKFVGGPGTPGVLVAKRKLFDNRVPSVPGGGTVLFVTPSAHSYHPDPVIREEGGTPGIVESIRAGLVFALKEEVGAEEIRRREHDLARRALRSWGASPNIEILGDAAAERLPIVSLGLRHRGRLLHANFVVAVLSDLFGIQARSGCDRVFAYILDAVHLIAKHGWKLLPLYRFDPDSGLWRHRAGVPDPPTSLTSAVEAAPRRFTTAPESVLPGQLEAARRLVRSVQAHPPARPLHDPELSDEFERIRWFELPGEALDQLRSTVTSSPVAAAERQRHRENRAAIRRVLQPSDRGGSHGT